jgi:hypothetical protein
VITFWLCMWEVCSSYLDCQLFLMRFYWVFSISLCEFWQDIWITTDFSKSVHHSWLFSSLIWYNVTS